jgi:hypothetical protein
MAQIGAVAPRGGTWRFYSQSVDVRECRVCNWHFHLDHSQKVYIFINIWQASRKLSELCTKLFLRKSTPVVSKYILRMWYKNSVPLTIVPVLIILSFILPTLVSFNDWLLCIIYVFCETDIFFYFNSLIFQFSIIFLSYPHFIFFGSQYILLPIKRLIHNPLRDCKNCDQLLFGRLSIRW